MSHRRKPPATPVPSQRPSGENRAGWVVSGRERNSVQFSVSQIFTPESWPLASSLPPGAKDRVEAALSSVAMTFREVVSRTVILLPE